jgi:predicted RNase H-like HicB family nuclease
MLFRNLWVKAIQEYAGLMKKRNMKKYAVVIESGPRNYSAYVPDLPGCVATGRTLEEVRENIRGAVNMHVGAMVEDGDTLPEWDSFGETVEAQQPAFAS